MKRAEIAKTIRPRNSFARSKPIARKGMEILTLNSRSPGLKATQLKSMASINGIDSNASIKEHQCGGKDDPSGGKVESLCIGNENCEHACSTW